MTLLSDLNMKDASCLCKDVDFLIEGPNLL